MTHHFFVVSTQSTSQQCGCLQQVEHFFQYCAVFGLGDAVVCRGGYYFFRYMAKLFGQAQYLSVEKPGGNGQRGAAGA